MISTQRIKDSKNKLVTVLQVPSSYFRVLHISFFHIYFFTFLLLSGCGPATTNETFQKLSPTDQLKYQKYIIQGRELYLANCASCHQKDGQGVKKLIPPLAGSDFLKFNQQKSMELIRHGATEPITVLRQTYPPTMPGHPHLSHLEMAELMTYINNSWGNEFGFVDGKKLNPNH